MLTPARGAPRTGATTESQSPWTMAKVSSEHVTSGGAIPDDAPRCVSIRAAVGQDVRWVHHDAVLDHWEGAPMNVRRPSTLAVLRTAAVVVGLGLVLGSAACSSSKERPTTRPRGAETTRRRHQHDDHGGEDHDRSRCRRRPAAGSIPFAELSRSRPTAPRRPAAAAPRRHRRCPTASGSAAEGRSTRRPAPSASTSSASSSATPPTRRQRPTGRPRSRCPTTSTSATRARPSAPSRP